MLIISEIGVQTLAVQKMDYIESFVEFSSCSFKFFIASHEITNKNIFNQCQRSCKDLYILNFSKEAQIPYKTDYDYN